MVDFHSHVLPGIDDGAKSIEESLEILQKMSRTGTDILYCTPHFYPHKQSLEAFLEKRGRAYESLVPFLKPDFPQLRLGAEVLMSSSLLDKAKIDRLKLEGTDFVLLEMPYIHFSQTIYDGVQDIADMNGVNVLVAHIERYLKDNSEDEVKRLFGAENVFGQINCTSLRSFSSRRACLRFIKGGYVHALGTDYHRIERGYALMDEGVSILRSKLGRKGLERLLTVSEMISDNRSPDEISEVMA